MTLKIGETEESATMCSDTDLVRAARLGDVTSLGLLLESYRASLHGQALRLLGHGPQAQDAVQDTFLIALRKLDQIREPEAVGGWLHAILRNVCLMRIREDRGEVLFEEVPRRIEQRSFESSAEEAIDRLAMRDWVWTALGELPESLRVTAMLRYFGGYPSYEEISSILGVPVGTVKSRLNGARLKLADALLRTAGLEHGEARRLTESRSRFFEAVFEEYNRGEGLRMLTSAMSEDDFVWSYSDGTIIRGRAEREFWIRGLYEDSQSGVKLHPTNIVVGKDITILEGAFENPSEDPFHCPPATSIVYSHRDGRVHRVRQYYTPRKTTAKEGGEEPGKTTDRPETILGAS